MSPERLDEFQSCFWEKCNFDDIKSDKKQSFTLSSGSIYFEIYS